MTVMHVGSTRLRCRQPRAAMREWTGARDPAQCVLAMETWAEFSTAVARCRFTGRVVVVWRGTGGEPEGSIAPHHLQRPPDCG